MKPFVIILSLLTFASTYTISAQNLETSPNTVSFKKSGKPRHINRFADKGYFGFAEFNFALGETYTIQYDGSSSESNRIKSYGLDIVNGYRTSPWFAIGIGIGVRYYDCEDLLIPYYIHLRTDILDRRVTPFFALNIGGATFSYITTLFLAEPTAGIAIRFKGGDQLNIGVGASALLFNNGTVGFKLSIGYAW